MNIFAADIGGTNSRFAYFEADKNGELNLTKTQWLKTKEAPSFGSLIADLQESTFALQPDKADIAVIAVAGPVEQGVYSSPPFIAWDIDIANALSDFGFKKCLLINQCKNNLFLFQHIYSQLHFLDLVLHKPLVATLLLIALKADEHIKSLILPGIPFQLEYFPV